VIRTAIPSDLPLLRDIERAAGAPFRDIGMTAIADDEPPTIEQLTAYRKAGRAWVWGAPAVAYILVDVVDGHAHIEQVSVHPGQSHRGIGRALIDHVDRWAAARGLAGLTLTTFAHVPWNGPYYARLGFTTVTGLTPGLLAIRAHEATLDAWPRVVMRRPVSTA
jgi:GNAT superfamily N-acetyltransferase